MTTRDVRPPPTDLPGKMIEEFRFQATGCLEIGSPLYSDLCMVCAEDIARRGPVWRTIESDAAMRFGLALPLRFLASVHRLALRGDVPHLAAHFPSCGGVRSESLVDDFLAAVEEHRDRITRELAWGVQTNEVVRTAALYPGLAAIAALTQRPLSLREIGTSAGLNLRLDHFHYAQADWSIGDPGAAVEITDRWGKNLPPSSDAVIVDRAGCDPNPIDPTTPHGAIHLLGFLWPDQFDRRTRTIGAIETAIRHPARIDALPADVWLQRELAALTRGSTTVVMHSIVWQYIDPDERRRITALLQSAGDAADADAPLAWLSFEPQEPHRSHAALTLRLWDGGPNSGTPTVLAECGYHGQWVRWIA